MNIQFMPYSCDHVLAAEVAKIVTELRARLSALEAEAAKPKIALAPDKPREPGWYPFFDAAGECTTYYWREGYWYPFKNSELPARHVPQQAKIGPRIQESEE